MLALSYYICRGVRLMGYAISHSNFNPMQVVKEYAAWEQAGKLELLKGRIVAQEGYCYLEQGFAYRRLFDGADIALLEGLTADERVVLYISQKIRFKRIAFESEERWTWDGRWVQKVVETDMDWEGVNRISEMAAMCLVDRTLMTTIGNRPTVALLEGHKKTLLK